MKSIRSSHASPAIRVTLPIYGIAARRRREIVLGDARLRLREAPDRAFRLIVLDAFSSDSLPVHLLSREAIQLYRSKLSPGGVLVFNLSNRYLDLDPVIGRQAADAGLACWIGYDVERQPGREAGRQAALDLGCHGRG